MTRAGDLARPDISGYSSNRLPCAVVVAGTVGGAGATTLAVLLGVAIAEQERRKVLVLDAAPAGGDLAPRVFGTVNTGQQWDAWARAGANTSALLWQLGGNDWGTVVLGADTQAPDAGRLLASVIDTVTAKGWIVVVDAGSGAPGSPALGTAVRVCAALLLAIPQHARGANRARLYLSRLVRRYGPDVVGDAVVAVSDHEGRHTHVYRAVARGLHDKVSGVVRIPTDPQLSNGISISPNDIRQATRTSMSAVISALTGTDAARHRPAR